MNKLSLMMLLLCGMCGALPGNTPSVELSTPQYVSTRFAKEGIWKRFDISERMNPFYLTGDFDGDGKPDFVVLLKSKESSREYKAFVFSSFTKVLIKERGDREFDGWEVAPRGTKAGKSRVAIPADGLIEKWGGPGILEVWERGKFKTYNWGD